MTHGALPLQLPRGWRQTLPLFYLPPGCCVALWVQRSERRSSFPAPSLQIFPVPSGAPVLTSPVSTAGFDIVNGTNDPQFLQSFMDLGGTGPASFTYRCQSGVVLGIDVSCRGAAKLLRNPAILYGGRVHLAAGVCAALQTNALVPLPNLRRCRWP